MMDHLNFSMFWHSLHPSISPKDCFHFGENQGHWYGGGESLSAAWPLEEGHIVESPFITGDEVSAGFHTLKPCWVTGIFLGTNCMGKCYQEILCK